MPHMMSTPMRIRRFFGALKALSNMLGRTRTGTMRLRIKTVITKGFNLDPDELEWFDGIFASHNGGTGIRSRRAFLLHIPVNHSAIFRQNGRLDMMRILYSIYPDVASGRRVIRCFSEYSEVLWQTQ